MPTESVLHVSAIVIVGSQRVRAQQCITALCEQQGARQLEIVIVDYGASMFGKLKTIGEASIKYLPLAEHITWGKTRAYAVEQSSASIIAFVEEHAQPQAGWLRAIVEAFETYNLSAATYSFISSNPDIYMAWAGHIAAYGLWTAPASAISSKFIPWSNITIRRDFMMTLDDNIASLLENDVVIADYLRRKKANYMQIDKAVVLHLGHERFRSLMGAVICGSQLLASERVKYGQWSWARRLAYAMTVPFIVPLMKMRRLTQHYLTTPLSIRELMFAMPIVIPAYVVGAFAEAKGYIFVSDEVYTRFMSLEINDQRDMQIDS
jgi:hypothetical protein